MKSSILLNEQKFRQRLIEVLQQEVLFIEFRKKDGDIRGLMCSLQEKHIPIKHEEESRPKPSRELNPDICRVVDINTNRWKSFYFEAVIYINGKTPNDYFFNEKK